MHKEPSNYKNLTDGDFVSELPCKFNGLFINSCAAFASIKIYDLDKTTKTLVSPTLLNGGFETAGGGGADVFANWVEAVAGTSTVNKDIVEQRSGTNCCRLYVDAVGSGCSISTGAILTVGKVYKLTLYTKVNDATGNPTIKLYTNATVQSIKILTTSYVKHEIYFTAEGTALTLSRDGANTKSIYFDDITLEEYITIPIVLNTITMAAIATPSTGNLLKLPQINCKNGLMIDITGVMDCTILWN